jgi:hypothetical protein
MYVTIFVYNIYISLDTFRFRRMDHTVFHKWIIKQTKQSLFLVDWQSSKQITKINQCKRESFRSVTSVHHRWITSISTTISSTMSGEVGFELRSEDSRDLFCRHLSLIAHYHLFRRQTTRKRDTLYTCSTLVQWVPPIKKEEILGEDSVSYPLCTKLLTSLCTLQSKTRKW